MKMFYIGLDIGGTKCAVTLGKTDKENIEISDKKNCNIRMEIRRGKRAAKFNIYDFWYRTWRGAYIKR